MAIGKINAPTTPLISTTGADGGKSAARAAAKELTPAQYNELQKTSTSTHDFALKIIAAQYGLTGKKAEAAATQIVAVLGNSLRFGSQVTTSKEFEA